MTKDNVVEKINEDFFRLHLKEARSVSDLLERLNLKIHFENRKNINNRLARMGSEADHLSGKNGVRKRRRTSIIWTSLTNEDFTRLVENNFSVSAVLKVLGLVSRGSNFRSFQERVDFLKINTSHFTANRDKSSQRIALEDIIFHNLHPQYKSSHLKKRLLDAKLKENKCEICNITEWNGKPISLHLDHINGDNGNNHLSNLRILCPNCHSQTDTFGARNKKTLRR